MVRTLADVKLGLRFAVGVRHERARPDIVHVVGKSSAMTDVQVLVVVLGEDPPTGRLTPVILGIPRPDLDRQILPGGIEGVLEEPSVAGRTVVDDPKFAPTSRYASIRSPCQRSCPAVRTTRSDVDGSRRVLADHWRWRFQAKQSDDGLARDPIRPLGELYRGEFAVADVVQDGRAGQRCHLGDLGG